MRKVRSWVNTEEESSMNGWIVWYILWLTIDDTKQLLRVWAVFILRWRWWRGAEAGGNKAGLNEDWGDKQTRELDSVGTGLRGVPKWLHCAAAGGRTTAAVGTRSIERTTAISAHLSSSGWSVCHCAIGRRGLASMSDLKKSRHATLCCS